MAALKSNIAIGPEQVVNRNKGGVVKYMKAVLLACLTTAGGQVNKQKRDGPHRDLEGKFLHPQKFEEKNNMSR